MDKITELVYKIYGNIGKKDGEGFIEVIEGCKEYQELLGYENNDLISYAYEPKLELTDAEIRVTCTLTLNGKHYERSMSTSSIKTLVHEEDFIRTGAMVLLDLSVLLYSTARKLFEEVIMQHSGDDKHVLEAVRQMATKVI